MPHRKLRAILANEFRGYDASALRADLLAAMTVAAVALPLALAFGAASGATPAAGMVTAILAGLVIGGLSGAPYQISGPTGAMSAVLIGLAHRYGLEGVWIAGMLSGVVLLAIGLFRLGRFITFVPAPVISGFTSGIALIIAIGQIDNLLGIATPPAESAAGKLFLYGRILLGGEAARDATLLGGPGSALDAASRAFDLSPDWRAVALGGLVMLTMIAWPRRLNARFPGSLLGIVLATIAAAAAGWHVAAIGEIPHALVLDERLSLAAIPWSRLREFVAPTLTIAGLGAVESLLCGAVASNMTGIRLGANQELIAQGAGNILLPFFGGVPATAAIARTSVGIKSGGRTRLVSIIHALILLAAMFALAPLMSRIPLAALAGVLIVTAWRMNEWESIHFIVSRRFKVATLTFAITMLATVMLDLTQAILIGAILSAGIFLNEIAEMKITVADVDPEKLRDRGIDAGSNCRHVRVAYITGPLFFAATGHFHEAFARLGDTHALILSMRAVPLIDTSGLQAMATLQRRLAQSGGTLMLAGVHPEVREMLRRGGLEDAVGAENIFWSADQAIVAIEKRPCRFCRATEGSPDTTGRRPPSAGPNFPT